MTIQSDVVRLALFILLTCICPVSLDAEDLVPAKHSHNDYLHPRPLYDALDSGYASVEADVFLFRGKLVVAHSIFEIDESRTLRSLYLEPLRELYRASQPTKQISNRFTLMVDIKSAGEPTYRALSNELNDFRDMLQRVENGKLISGPCEVIVSGNRPFRTIEADKNRCVAIDGRMQDVDSNIDTGLMPMISDNWSSHFSWNGEGDMPIAERKKLRSIVTKVHQEGKRLRFWATPEKESLWKVLKEEQVDVINTDMLIELDRFLSSH